MGAGVACRKPFRPLFPHLTIGGQSYRGGILDPKDNHVYLMTDASGYFAIGCSRNPKKKVSELRKVNPTIKLVSTRKESHGTASRQKGRYHERYAHRKILGEWFSLSDKEAVELLGDFDTGTTFGAIKKEVSKLKTPVDKRDTYGLRRAFEEKFVGAYPASLRPHLSRLVSEG